MRLRKDRLAAVVNHVRNRSHSDGRMITCPCCDEEDFYYASYASDYWRWRCHWCWFMVTLCVRYPGAVQVLQFDGPVAEEDR